MAEKQKNTEDKSLFEATMGDSVADEVFRNPAEFPEPPKPRGAPPMPPYPNNDPDGAASGSPAPAGGPGIEGGPDIDGGPEPEGAPDI